MTAVAPPDLRTRHTYLVLLFFVSLTILIIIGQTWWAISQDKQLAVESEKKNGFVAVRALEEHAIQTLQDTDRTINAVVKAIRRAGDGVLADDAAVHRILVQEKQETEHIQSLRLINAKGISWVTSLEQPSRQIDVSDRQYARFLAEHADYRKTFIGDPVKSRYDGQWIVPVVRNLYDRNGTRIGIIGAYIRVSYLANFYSRVSESSRAMVSLHSDEGHLILHTPLEEKLLGKNILDSSTAQQMRNGPTEGVFESASFFGGPGQFLYAYKKIPEYKVTVAYAKDHHDMMAPWRSRSVDRIIFAGATVLSVGTLAILLLFHIRRLHQSEESLAASENRYAMLYQSASDGVVLINQNHMFVDCNPTTLKMFGVQSKRDVIGKKVDSFSPDFQPETNAPRGSKLHLLDEAFKGVPQRFEWATLCHGELRHNEITLSLAKVNNEPLLLGVVRDVSANKQSEALQKDQNKILHMIGTGEDLQKVLAEITRFLERRAPRNRCTIFLLNEKETHFVYGIGPSLPEQLVREMTALEIRMGNGTSSESVLTNYPVIAENIAADTSMEGMRKLMEGTDFTACGSWPIMGKRGQILGAYSVFYRDHGTPNAEEMQLIGIGTDLASIAIESRRAEDRIRHLAHYDELTGLPNRFLYLQHLEKAIAHAERYSMPVGVLFLDLDRFKNINDTFGHEAGDAVLRNVADRFRNTLRDADVVARIGGDEFIVLVDECRDPLELSEIARKLLKEAAKPFEISGQECQLGVSIGIASYPDDGLDAQVLLKNADIAMYRAKVTGKNNYQYYSAEMNTHTLDHIALEAKLHRAIERSEFVMHYQPKVDVATGQIVGAEALVRWNHPERGLLFPGEFIALAEEVGLIGSLGMLVLDTTCRDLIAFKKAGISFGRIAINLSGSQFNDCNLLNDVKDVLTARGIDPSCIEFEITESMVMHNREQATSLMDEIKKLGFSLSIDDFGTGYSSLAYLKRFPVDSVKVDKSFINDIPQDSNDAAIVQAIIALAHTLGLKVIAEGVENETQLETLQRFGCDEYQGYYCSKAIPGKDFIAFVERQTATIN